MIKKHLMRNAAIALTMAMLPVNICFAAANEIQCTPSVDGKNVTCTVTLPEVKGNGAVLMVTKKDITDVQQADVYAVELITEKNPAPITFVMPDEAVGDANAQYSVIIRNGSDAEKSFHFYYTKPAVTEQIMINLRATARADIETFMQGSTDGIINIAGLASSGFKLDIYNGITANKALAWDLYYAKAADFPGMTDSALISHMNESVISAALNETGANVAALLTELNRSFNGTEYVSMPDAQKQWLNQNVSAKLPISLTNTATDVIDVANILYSFNNARYSDIDSLVTNYGAKVGIASSSYYATYQTLDSTRKTAAQENMVTSLSTAPANMPSDLITVFETAVMAASTIPGQPGGVVGGFVGGTGGGGDGVGSGSKGGLVVNSSTQVVNPEKPFNDLDTVSWAEEAIAALYKKEIISGMGDRKFCPQDLVTREQMVKMILLASGFSPLNVDTDFEDVDSRAWYAPYVAHAVKQKIAAGMDAVTFGIGRNITRQDAAVMIDRAMNKINRTKDAAREYTAFADEAEIADYAEEAIKKLYASGVVNGKENNCFAPTQTCTRAEAAKMIYDAFIK